MNSCTAGGYSGPDYRIFDFSFINIDSGFAVGTYSYYYATEGLIYKRGVLANIFEKETERIRVFPNPFSDKVTIGILEPNFDTSNITLIVYDIFGKEILNMPMLKNDQTTIYLKNLPKGIYYLIIKNKNKTVHTEKLIKL